MTHLHTNKPTDISGCAIFFTGHVGDAHVAAHRMLDEGRYQEGFEQLEAWLEGREGRGADWAHIQWHMMVFEIAVGQWHAAHRRFRREILPIVEASDDALTDAPAGLWRLMLNAPSGWHASLPWDAVQRRSLQHVGRPCEPFVAVHHLLAFAGAGDVASIDLWFRGAEGVGSIQAAVLRQLSLGLRAFAIGDYESAAMKLSVALGRLHIVGGSRAQRELFSCIRDEASSRLAQCDTPPPSRRAA